MSRSFARRFGCFGVIASSSLGCSEEAVAPTPGPTAQAGTAGVVSSAGSAGDTSGGAATGGAQPSTSAGSGGMGGLAEVGTSGTGGTSTAGTAGASGSSGGDDPSPAVRSAGCGNEATQPFASWNERPNLNVNGDDRQWWVWLPSNYDAARAYPVVFTLHGCGGPGNFIPIQEATGSDAIVVRGSGAANGCWTYGLEGDDVRFFDAMLETLQAQYCVDTSRVFSIGYSSGAWMTNTLECSRGDKLRATGTLSGGRAHAGTSCKGKFARATVHDRRDPTNPFDDWQEGNQQHNGQGAAEELARVVARNGCQADAAPIPEAPAPCARYQGCDPGYPVIACLTEGEGHDRQDDLAIEVFWKLFSSL